MVNKEKFANFFDKIKLFINKNNVIPYTLIAIAICFLTFMLTAQMHTVNNSEELSKGKREAELIDDLAQLQRKYDDLSKLNDENEKVVNEYKNNSASNNELIASMQKRLNILSLYSCSEDVFGEGIIITLNDGEKVIDPSLRTDAIVHDTDILTVVNELKAAGAEAISVNNERITATTAIRCVGPVIQVNYQKVAAPFTIKAIGNAQYLESAINIKNGIADLLSEIGIKVDVKRNKNIRIDKFSGVFNFEHSTIVKEN